MHKPKKFKDPETVNLMLMLKKEGKSFTDLASIFGVHHTTVMYHWGKYKKNDFYKRKKKGEVDRYIGIYKPKRRRRSKKAILKSGECPHCELRLVSKYACEHCKPLKQ